MIIFFTNILSKLVNSYIRIPIEMGLMQDDSTVHKHANAHVILMFYDVYVEQYGQVSRNGNTDTHFNLK